VRGTNSEPEPVRAHEAAGKERERLWKLVTGVSPFYVGFQRKTKRLIPLFVLESAGSGSGS
jgi:hypothetical protein